MSKERLSPSKSFTDKVMLDVRKRPRKIGLWNLAYVAPFALAIALLVIPSTREAMVNTTDTQHSAVNSVQQNVDDMQVMMDQFNSFGGDELNAIEYVSSN